MNYAKTRTIFLLAVMLLLGSVSPCLAESPLPLIHKQAWRLDPELGEAAPGHEEEFAKTRKDLATFIEVFQVGRKPDRLTNYIFQAEDGFLITSITAALKEGEDGWFMLTGPKLSPDSDNVWYYKVQDRDTLLYRQSSGTYVYKRLPDFVPPPDPFTDRSPLPWK